MQTEIEKFLFGRRGDHCLHSLTKRGDVWIIVICPSHDLRAKKTYVFGGVEEEYEQSLMMDGEELEWPLPIVSFESESLAGQRWRFVLDAADIKWCFVSDWPAAWPGGRGG